MLVISLTHEVFRETTGPMLMELLQQAIGKMAWRHMFDQLRVALTCPVQRLSQRYLLDAPLSVGWPTVLLKEATYSAITLCANELYDYVDAGGLLMSRLLPEAMDPTLPADLYVAQRISARMRRGRMTPVFARFHAPASPPGRWCSGVGWRCTSRNGAPSSWLLNTGRGCTTSWRSS